MEFGEKLRELRLRRGLTQEELSQVLFVSRTAVSKWESGRGYPSIDSLKDISAFFGVSVDELLSTESLLGLAQKEKAADIKNICCLLWGITDLLYALLIFLPLYPENGGKIVYAVNLFAYGNGIRIIYFALFLSQFILGVLGIISAKIKKDRFGKIITQLSLAAGVISVAVAVVGRVPYAAITAFFLLLIKGVLLVKRKN